MKRVPAARLFFLLVRCFSCVALSSIWGGSPSERPPRSRLHAKPVNRTPPRRPQRHLKVKARIFGSPQSPFRQSESENGGQNQTLPIEEAPPGRKSEGSYHTVKKGQNLFGISRAYHVSIEDLVKANHLSKPSALQVGQRLFIPGASQAQRVEPFKPLSGKQRMEIGKSLEPKTRRGGTCRISNPLRTRDPLKEGRVRPPIQKERGWPESPGEGSEEQAHVAPPGISPERPINTGPEGFIWPLINRITSRFGPRGRRMHTGVDIAAPSYHEVVAAADGEVIYMQHSRRGLGNAVVLQHDNGYTTVYGHGVVILVQEGDTVKRGSPSWGWETPAIPPGTTSTSRSERTASPSTRYPSCLPPWMSSSMISGRIGIWRDTS